MIPLQVTETVDAIDRLAGKNDATVIGTLFLFIVLLIAYIVYTIRKGDKKEEKATEERIETIKMLTEFANSIENSKSETTEVKRIVGDIKDGVSEVLIYVRTK